MKPKFLLWTVILFSLYGCASEFYISESSPESFHYIKFCKNGYFVDYQEGMLVVGPPLVYGTWTKSGGFIQVNVISPPNKAYDDGNTNGNILEYHQGDPDSLYIEVQSPEKDISFAIYLEDIDSLSFIGGSGVLVFPRKGIKNIFVNGPTANLHCHHSLIHQIKDTTKNYLVFQFAKTFPKEPCVQNYPRKYKRFLWWLYPIDPVTGKRQKPYRIRRRDKHRLDLKYDFCRTLKNRPTSGNQIADTITGR